jgi:hypothetical protein
VRSAPRYIGRMSEPGTTYEVSIEEPDPDGRSVWRVLLRTKDRVAAQALLDSLKADEGVRARMLEEPGSKRK